VFIGDVDLPADEFTAINDVEEAHGCSLLNAVAFGRGIASSTVLRD
jgi:hypothetical protein